MSGFDKFLAIREAYAYLLPEWMEEYEETGDMRQDPYFMNWDFTPIENSVWSDIRTIGVPFFPQMPVLKYFIDFGCPFLKIGIECDGKAWHDHELDKARDARLHSEGWMIFRIEGHECKRVIDPWAEERYGEEEDDQELIYQYFMTTSEGIIHAIKSRYFDDEMDERYASVMHSTLFEHRSTPETNPIRRQITKQSRLMRASEALEDYLKLLEKRARRAAA